MKDKPTAELIRDARRLNREMCELLAATHYSYEDGCDAWVKMTKLFPEIQRNQEALADRLERQCEEIEVLDKLVEERNRLLRAMECPAHGQCVPGAIEKWERTQTRLAEAERVIEFYSDLQPGEDSDFCLVECGQDKDGEPQHQIREIDENGDMHALGTKARAYRAKYPREGE